MCKLVGYRNSGYLILPRKLGSLYNLAPQLSILMQIENI